MKKIIPNLFTLLNLFFGCMSIVFALQTNNVIIYVNDQYNSSFNIPEKISWAAICIIIAAVIDFLDGFVARLLKATSEIGKQLDSLSDVVSFGVAPGMIFYQLLRIGYAEGTNGLETSFGLLLPAFLFTCAVAWRLAKFNVSTNQSDSFKGVPSPAAGLVVASFPLIIWYEYFNLQFLFINVWFLYAAVILLSFLMVCNRTFIALKFKTYSLQKNSLNYSLIFLSVISIVFLKWFAIPVIFILYLLFSAFAKPGAPIESSQNNKTLDLTV